VESMESQKAGFPPFPHTRRLPGINSVSMGALAIVEHHPRVTCTTAAFLAQRPFGTSMIPVGERHVHGSTVLAKTWMNDWRRAPIRELKRTVCLLSCLAASHGSVSVALHQLRPSCRSTTVRAISVATPTRSITLMNCPCSLVIATYGVLACSS
jgi:hypothetical protein